MIQHRNIARWQDVTCWVFDLDNTLYPPSTGLLDQVTVLMTAFIADRLRLSTNDANRLHQTYTQRHGATMVGLHLEHGIEPAEFLAVCHDLDTSGLTPNTDLGNAITALNGRKIIHTNGPRHHAERVLGELGLTTHFEELVAVEDTGFVAKPAIDAHRRAVEITGIDPAEAAMIEDSTANLLHPSQMGMRTILVDHAGQTEKPDHVDHMTTDLTGFLRTVVAAAC